MKQIKTAQEAIAHIKDGDSIMVGGFMCCGQAYGLVDAILDKGLKNIILITNDAGLPGKGAAKLIEQKRVGKLIASHIGLNPEAGKQMNSGEMKVELVPQGTLVERIRAAGAGLGGVLTPTGLGTAVAEGKQVIEVEDKLYLLEKPLRADYAFIKAHTIDKYGNAYIAKAEKNFNIVMALAARTVIVEAEHIVEPGQLDPDKVTLPGALVHVIVEAKK